jgi:hypothetical protein
MFMRPKLPLSFAALAVFTTLSHAAFADPRPVGGEIRVNGNAESKQRNPIAASAPAGRSLVVWENDKLGLRGRFFNRDGSPGSAEISLVANQRLPGVPAQGEEILRKDASVAFLPTGEFLLAWTDERAYVRVDIFIEDRQLLDRDIFIQRFTAAGVPTGPASRVNAASAGFQSQPKILNRNNFPAVVVWQSDDLSPTATAGDGIFAHLVTKATGRPFGDDFRVSSAGGANPAAAALANGDFMVTWEAFDGDSLGVYARAFYRDPQAEPGQVPGNYRETRLNEKVVGLQRRPALVASGALDYLVVWQSQDELLQKGAHIAGRTVSQLGEPEGRSFAISRGVGPTQISPSIAKVKGGFLITWLDWNDVYPIGVFAALVDDQGRLRSSEVKLSDQQIGAHFRTSIAADENSVFIAWEGYLNRLQGITARRVEP